MSHWKTGVKILCSKSWEGQNSMKAKIWGSKFYFFLVEPLVKILCSLKRGVKILYFFPVPWKRGVKTAEPTNQLHWRGAPPPGHKPCRTFHPWCPCIKTRCLYAAVCATCLIHSGWIIHIRDMGSSWHQLMACCLFDTKPSPKLTLICFVMTY